MKAKAIAPRRPAYLVGIPDASADSQLLAELLAHYRAEAAHSAEYTERCHRIARRIERQLQAAAQATDAPADEYVTVKEAAARLGVCVETIRARLRAGTLEGVARGRLQRVNMAALRERGR